MKRLTLIATTIAALVLSVHAQDYSKACADVTQMQALLADAVQACKVPAPVPVPVPVPTPTPTPTPIPIPSTLPQLAFSDLVYQGAFKVPHGGVGGDPSGDGFASGNAGFAFNPAHGSLFLNGHSAHNLTAELSIPTPVNSTNLASLPTATILQNFADLTEGHLKNILAAGGVTRNAIVGGLLVFNGSLIGTSYEYYDANNDARLSHFTSSTTLVTTGDFKGMFLVGDPLKTGFVSGYMGLVPQAWQAALGGPVLTGNCCLSIISRTNWGPGVSVFDPSTLGSATPATPLIDYPSSAPLDTFADRKSSTLFIDSDQVTGAVFPEGTRSVLFFGKHGTGPWCYGEGTPTAALDHTLVGATEPGVIYCFDPAINSKGSHAYPYVHYVWVYDANDLAAVRAGAKVASSMRPYATWTLPYVSSFAGYSGLAGATADPATKRIFVAQRFGDGNYPLIHVYKTP